MQENPSHPSQYLYTSKILLRLKTLHTKSSQYFKRQVCRLVMHESWPIYSHEETKKASSIRAAKSVRLIF